MTQVVTYMENAKELLLATRRVLRVTQGQVAEAIGCSRPHIGKMESGQTPVTDEALVWIADQCEQHPEIIEKMKKMLHTKGRLQRLLKMVAL